MATTLTFPAASGSEELVRAIQASRLSRSVRSALVTTRDRQHAFNVVRESASACSAGLHHFSAAGRWRYNPATLSWETTSSEVTDPYVLLLQAQELKGGGVVILEDAAAPLQDRGGDVRMRMLLSRMLSPDYSCEGLVLVFLEPPGIGGEYLPMVQADQFLRIDLGFPRRKELEAIARKELAAAAHRAGKPMEVDAVRAQAPRLAEGMVGLTRSAARDAILDALALDPTDVEAAAKRLADRKGAHLAREMGMRVLDAEGAEEPLGLDYLVSYLQSRRESVRLRGRDRARAILLVGPPGTGKTLLARAVGGILHLPVVEFRIGAMMDSYLGRTEQRFLAAFAALEAMAPNVVFIDEIEKAFAQGGSENDGGTMMRSAGSLLSWLSDNQEPNFIVATANNLARMGEIGQTMTRSERFDALFFVDVPGPEGRRKMLQKFLAEQVADPAAVAAEMAGITEKFSGADLRSCVKEAVQAARSRRLTVDDLRAQILRKRERALALFDRFQELRRWGRIFCDPAGPTD